MLACHISPTVLTRKHVGPACTSGDHFLLCSFPVPDIEVRQQKGEVGDATPDLVLKHSDTTIATYVSKQMKQLKHASETLAKTPKTLETIVNIRNIQIKHLHHMCESICSI
jgi:hypothetical protein